jgi:hypothetical protein
MNFSPSFSPFNLLLGPERDDLERLPLDELRLVHEYERQRLGLTKTVGIGIGVAGALATGKIILK